MCHIATALLSERLLCEVGCRGSESDALGNLALVEMNVRLTTDLRRLRTFVHAIEPIAGNQVSDNLPKRRMEGVNRNRLPVIRQNPRKRVIAEIATRNGSAKADTADVSADLFRSPGLSLATQEKAILRRHSRKIGVHFVSSIRYGRSPWCKRSTWFRMGATT